MYLDGHQDVEWTGLPVVESTRMREDRDKWKKYVHGVANPRIENGTELITLTAELHISWLQQVACQWYISGWLSNSVNRGRHNTKPQLKTKC